jgi:hypothetical protein
MTKLSDSEAREKRHNPWYCKACRKLVYISYGITYDEKDGRDYEVPVCPICGSLDVVEKPERETPEEFKSRTGRPWDDGSAVYMKMGKNDWQIKTYMEAKKDAAYCKMDAVPYIILCANSDSGIPGPSEFVVLENQIIGQGVNNDA